MPHEDDEEWSSEWREVQDQRYNKDYYPQSGKINPFFTRMGGANRRFGWQLLFAALLCAVLGVACAIYVKPITLIAFVPFTLICLIGGIQHLRMTRVSGR